MSPCWGFTVRTTTSPSIGCRRLPLRSPMSCLPSVFQSGVCPPVANSLPSAFPRSSSLSLPTYFTNCGPLLKRTLSTFCAFTGTESEIDARHRARRRRPCSVLSIACIDPAVDRADEQHADALSRQEVVHQRRVGELERFLRLLQLAHLSQCGVALTLGLVALFLRDPQIRLVRDAAAREPDADEDPDDQRDEDRRERRDVVAKVEHAATSLPRSARARGAG